MTSLTLITLLVILYGLVSQKGYEYSLALGGATAAGAAVVVGSTAIPTFYAVALGVFAILCLRLLTPKRSWVQSPPPLPGTALLYSFFTWTLLITILAPFLFNGMNTRAFQGFGTLRAGIITDSNVAQIVYLLLGISVVVFLAGSNRARPELIGLTVGLTTLLSFWSYLHINAGVPYPIGLFDNSPNFAYIDLAPGYVPRFRGILSEPASLAVSCLVTITYMVSRGAGVRGWRRLGCVLVAGIALYLGWVSTSATFAVAGALILLVIGAVYVVGFFANNVKLSLVAAGVCGTAVIASFWLLPLVANFVISNIDDKVSSSSFDTRSTANNVGYDLFLNTFGLGVGIGSNRASSFFPHLLSTTGVIGTVLFALIVIFYTSGAKDVKEYRPVLWSLISLLIVKLVSGPDLSDSSGVLWMALGLLARATVIARDSAKDAELNSGQAERKRDQLLTTTISKLSSRT